MNFLEINKDISDVALHLIAALTDENPRVRIAAAQSLAEICPDQGREPLKRMWEQVPQNSDEQYALALALERCGEDTIPLIAPLLKVEAPADLSKMIRLPHDEWVDFLRNKERIITDVGLRLLYHIWGIRRQLEAMRTRAVEAESQPDKYEGTANTLENELFFSHIWLDNPEFKIASDELFNPILRSLRSKEKAEIRVAVLRLVEIALGEPNGWLRDASASALTRLEGEASSLLLASFLGNPPSLPTGDQIKALASQPFASETVRMKDLQSSSYTIEMAAHFATEALTKFTDQETASSVANLAVQGGAAGVRAEQVLADMALDVSLPALFWIAVNSSDEQERWKAASIVEKIINKDPNYGIHFHRVLPQFGVGRKLIEANLQWFANLIDRCLALPAWSAHPEEAGSLSWSKSKPATSILLRNAISMLPLFEGEVDISYMDRSAWDKFAGYARRITSLFKSSEVETKGPTAVQRYIDCNFPKRCVLNVPARLTVRLDVSPQTEDQNSSEVNIKFEKGRTSVDLLVMVRASGFSFSPDFQVLQVPLSEPSPEIEFLLEAKELGTQSVEISLFQGVERIGYCYLSVNVASKGVQKGQANTSLIEGISNSELLRRGETRAIIQVEWTKDGNLVYQIIDPSIQANDPQRLGISINSFPPQQVHEWITQQSLIIQEYLKEDYKTESDLRGALAGLRAIGHSLFKQLAPSSLAEFVQRWPSGSIIAVESSEGWVPWELLAASPGGELLGERFQLIRIPRIPQIADFDSTRVVPVEACAQPCAGIHKIISVIGDGINKGDQPGKYNTGRTFGAAASLVHDLVEETYDEFLKQVSDADLVHFTCHGRSTPSYHLSLGPGVGRRLLIAQVENLDIRPGVIIFANACSSGKPELFLNEFQNFGWNFYMRGARPFIGTLGSVPAEHAITFAQHFYKWFIISGLPAGQALRQARQDIAKEFRNPFFLFYCLYGPASACRRIHRSPIPDYR